MGQYSRMFGRPAHWAKRSYLARLPENYYKHVKDLEKPPVRIHDVEQKGQLLDYRIADPRTLRIERVPDRPVEVVYPKEADEGLWGGEGVVKGFLKYRIMYGVLTAKYWFPDLKKTVVYSEILDKYMSVVLTDRALNLIDQHKGFDNYILETPVQDFKSKLALDLRRKMLVALAKKDFHKDNQEMQNYVQEKYKAYLIPLAEAEWIGLDIKQATTKMKLIEALASRPRPLREQYTEELLQRLQARKEQEGGSSEKKSWYNTLIGSQQ